MKFSYTPSYKDAFWDYFRIYLYISIRKLFVILMLFSSIYFVLTDVVKIINNEKQWLELIDFPSLIFLLLPLVLILSTYRLTEQTLSNKKLKENITIHIDEAKIQYEGESFHNEYKWKDLVKIKETKNWFLLYVNKNFAQVIRKKDLSTNQVIDLRTIIQIKN